MLRDNTRYNKDMVSPSVQLTARKSRKEQLIWSQSFPLNEHTATGFR